jgi:hypothetical protein
MKSLFASSFLAALTCAVLLSEWKPVGAEAPAPVGYHLWENGPPTDPDYFPIGVWLQDPKNAKRYRALGINLYIGLWQGPTKDQLNQLKINKMPVICPQNEVGLEFRDRSTIIGWMHEDEPDNAQSRGNGVGYGPPIPPGEIQQGYVRMREADPTRPIFLNLGQGVAWDEWHGRGVRTNHPEDYPEYLKGCDIASFDIYPVASTNEPVQGNLWYVGEGVRRLNEWSQGSKPVWAVIETTNIKGPNRPTPAQVRSEVWMALIHGSRGICYFAHSFSPTFNETALLDDPEMAEGVRAINSTVSSLAPVLNSPTVGDRIAIESSSDRVPVIGLVKQWRGDLYLFAVSMRGEPTKALFTLQGETSGQEVEVLEEGRMLPIEANKFEDSFEGYAVHLYKIPGEAKAAP